MAYPAVISITGVTKFIILMFKLAGYVVIDGVHVGLTVILNVSLKNDKQPVQPKLH